MAGVDFSVSAEAWPLARPFITAREAIEQLPLAYLEIRQAGAIGRAEAAGVDYHGETVELIAAEIEGYLSRCHKIPDRGELLNALPPGGARNAIDCALWDLEAKLGAASAAEMAGLAPLRPLETVYTLSLESPQAMAAAIALAPGEAILKLKLGGRDGLDVARVAAVREAAPTRRLIVDVNEGWGGDELNEMATALGGLGVEMIEQPLPQTGIGALAGYCGAVALCADESCNLASDLDRLEAYRFVNIKLDKSGGLTAALELAKAARAAGKELMVGSMVGTSLGMAPAFLIGQLCTYVDLDGPLLLAGDRAEAMRFDGARVYPPAPALWG